MVSFEKRASRAVRTPLTTSVAASSSGRSTRYRRCAPFPESARRGSGNPCSERYAAIRSASAEDVGVRGRRVFPGESHLDPVRPPGKQARVHRIQGDVDPGHRRVGVERLNRPDLSTTPSASTLTTL